MLTEVTSKGGNLLLNVGPTARGVFDSRACDRLEGMGKWMTFNSRSIYGCTQAPDDYTTPSNCLLTWNPDTKRMYVHILEWPIRTLHLPGFGGKFKYAQLLHDASEVRFKVDGSKASLTLPVLQPDVEVPVVELFME